MSYRKPADDGTVQPVPTPELPKPRIRVAALPPADKQNSRQAVLRQNLTARNGGYDRNVAENMQRHEVMIDVIKGSF